MKVLMISHALSPVRGSEPGLGWTWAAGMASLHDVSVISHPMYRGEVEEYLQRHQCPRLRLRVVERVGDPDYHNRGAWPSALLYVRWLREAEKLAAELARREKFDLVHLVSMGTVGVGTRAADLGIPFIWGPIGGGQKICGGLARLAGGYSLNERIRNIRVSTLPVMPSIRTTARRSRLVLVTNRETRVVVERAGAKWVEDFLDSGVSDDLVPQKVPERPRRSVVQLLWCGRLLFRKALPLALRALQKVGDAPVKLVIAGDGPLCAQAQELCRKLGLQDKVRMLGHVPFSLMGQLYRESDVFLFSSIRDSFGGQVLEAMAQGLPIIAFDHQGVGAFLPDGAGIKVDPSNPDSAISQMAAAIRRMASNADLRLQMGNTAWEAAKKETWSARIRRMDALYRETVEMCHRAGSVRSV